MEATESYLRALSYAGEMLHLRYMLFESAGLFWLGAEVAILFLVREGRIYLQAAAPWQQPFWRRETRRRALYWAAAFALLAAAVAWRHMGGTPVYEVLQKGLLGDPVDLAALKEAVRQSTHRHLVVWWCFVNGWVLLEAWIVAEGIRAYRRLRQLLGPAAAGGPKAGAAVVVGGLAVLFSAPAWAVEAPVNAPHLLPAIKRALAEDAAYRDAMYLYLRLAGVAWVSVEWVAALVLWRAWRLLKATAEAAND